MEKITFPNGYYPLFNIGLPISNGKIYVGDADTDPVIVGNQKPVFAQQENGTIVPISQPVRTSGGGVPTYNGSPVVLLVDGEYSLKVLDENDSQIYYIPNSLQENQFVVTNLENDILNAGSTPTHLILTTPQTLTSNLIKPSNVTLEIYQGGTIGGAFTFTADEIIAGHYQIFESNLIVEGLYEGKVEWWGIDGTDDQIEINKCIAASNLTKLQPQKEYTCNDEVLVSKDKDFDGQNATLNFDSASGVFTNGACVYITGDAPTSLGTLATTLTKGTNSFTLSSPPIIYKKDIIVVVDTSDYSYSGFRASYKAGEYMMVDSVVGSDVTTVSDSYATYNSGGTRLVYKLNGTDSQVRDLKVIGRGVGYTTRCLTLRYGNKAELINIDADASQNANILIGNSYRCTISRINSDELLSDAYGTNYGIVIASSQSLKIYGCECTGLRHAISIGGAGSVFTTVTRDTLVSDSIFHRPSANSEVMAADIHGHCEYVQYSNCTTDGVNIGGNHNSIIGCIIHGNAGGAVHFTELVGFDFSVENNSVYTYKAAATGRGIFIDVGGNSLVLTGNTVFGGDLSITDNTVYDERADNPNNMVTIRNRGCTQQITVSLENNRFIGTFGTTGSDYGIAISVISGSAFHRVSLKNNTLEAYGISVVGALNVVARNNRASNSGQSGIFISAGSVISSQPILYSLKDNSVTGARLTGIFVSGESGNKIITVECIDNSSTENVKAATGSTSTDVGLYIAHAETVYSKNDSIGGTQIEQNFPAYYLSIDLLFEYLNHYYGTGTRQKVSVVSTGFTSGVSTGNGTVKMGSASSANNDGWYEIAPDVFVPYWDDPTP